MGGGEDHLHTMGDLAEQGVAIATGHAFIEEHQIDRVLLKNANGLLHGAHHRHHLHIPAEPQQLLQALQGWRFIVNQESAQRAGHRRGSSNVAITQAPSWRIENLAWLP